MLSPFPLKIKLSRLIALMMVLVMIFGLLPGSFAQLPSGNQISRAELVAKLTDYFGWPHPDDYNDIWKQQVPPKQFNDVMTSDTYGKQIEAAYEEGIISPDDQGNFRPNLGITREDAAVIIAEAYKLPASTTPTPFTDDHEISEDARGSVYALVELGCMTGSTGKLFKPHELIRKNDVDKILRALQETVVAPVYALPRQNYMAPRRYVKLYCPTPGATIYFTSDGSEPTLNSDTYTVRDNGHINEMLSNQQLPGRDVVYKAFAVKDGLISSEVQTFTWTLHRPVVDDFQHVKIFDKTATSPAVYQLFNDMESVRAMAWYIEGQDKGILFDALQASPDIVNFKDYIDNNGVATKPYDLIIGHSHPDHVAQIRAFINDHDVYSNIRGWGSLTRYLPSVEDQKKVMNIDWGDYFDLGGAALHVYALPGHANDNVILQDKVNGLIFASDIYGCTRAGSADNVGVSGMKVDLLLSFAQQVYSAYKEDGGKTTYLFTGHDEYPLADNNLRLFEAALQQVVDRGEEACSPTLRGKNNAPYARTTMIGDMWADNTNWISLLIGGIMGDEYEYLTNNDVANYNAGGFMKYSVLSNVEVEGGELVGKTLAWAGPSTFTFGGSRMTVENSLPNMFDPWSFEYEINVPEENDTITITPTTMSTQVKRIRLNGKQVDYRESVEVAVKDGMQIVIEVLAPDKNTTSTYTFTINKQ